MLICPGFNLIVNLANNKPEDNENSHIYEMFWFAKVFILTFSWILALFIHLFMYAFNNIYCICICVYIYSIIDTEHTYCVANTLQVQNTAVNKKDKVLAFMKLMTL